MKENKYDDITFFEKYSLMTRSQKGLDGAGEWKTLKKVLPDFKEKTVLDLGCGYGWHCFWAVENGAKSAIGVDISERMLGVAKKKNNYDNVEFICKPIEDISFEPESFDVVISSLAFHYIKSFDDIVVKISSCLRKDGVLVFSVEHPVFTAYGSQDWYRDDSGNILHFPVDNYFYEGERKAVFLGEEIIKYHKTLTTYINTLLQNGFELLNIIEPYPDEEMLNNSEMKNEMRRPMMLIVSARKK